MNEDLVKQGYLQCVSDTCEVMKKVTDAMATQAVVAIGDLICSLESVSESISKGEYSDEDFDAASEELSATHSVLAALLGLDMLHSHFAEAATS